MKKIKGYSLVFSQFLLILIMLLPLGTPANNLVIGIVVIFMGGVLGVFALYSNRFFNITPEIKDGACLVSGGAYKYIRHPMYTSALTVMLGVLILYPIKFVAICYGLLIFVLLVKLFYEESLWKAEDKEYVKYMKITKRLIPFVF